MENGILSSYLHIPTCTSIPHDWVSVATTSSCGCDTHFVSLSKSLHHYLGTDFIQCTKLFDAAVETVRSPNQMTRAYSLHKPVDYGGPYSLYITGRRILRDNQGTRRALAPLKQHQRGVIM